MTDEETTDGRPADSLGPTIAKGRALLLEEWHWIAGRLRDLPTLALAGGLVVSFAAFLPGPPELPMRSIFVPLFFLLALWFVTIRFQMVDAVMPETSAPLEARWGKSTRVFAATLARPLLLIFVCLWCSYLVGVGWMLVGDALFGSDLPSAEIGASESSSESLLDILLSPVSFIVRLPLFTGYLALVGALAFAGPTAYVGRRLLGGMSFGTTLWTSIIGLAETIIFTLIVAAVVGAFFGSRIERSEQAEAATATEIEDSPAAPDAPPEIDLMKTYGLLALLTLPSVLVGLFQVYQFGSGTKKPRAKLFVRESESAESDERDE